MRHCLWLGRASSTPWLRGGWHTYRRSGCRAELSGPGRRSRCCCGAGVCHQRAWSGWKRGTGYLPGSHAPNSFLIRRVHDPGACDPRAGLPPLVKGGRRDQVGPRATVCQPPAREQGGRGPPQPHGHPCCSARLSAHRSGVTETQPGRRPVCPVPAPSRAPGAAQGGRQEGRGTGCRGAGWEGRVRCSGSAGPERAPPLRSGPALPCSSGPLGALLLGPGTFAGSAPHLPAVASHSHAGSDTAAWGGSRELLEDADDERPV